MPCQKCKQCKNGKKCPKKRRKKKGAGIYDQKGAGFKEDAIQTGQAALKFVPTEESVINPVQGFTGVMGGTALEMIGGMFKPGLSKSTMNLMQGDIHRITQLFKHHRHVAHIQHGGWLHQGQTGAGLTEFFGAAQQVLPTTTSIFNPISGWGGMAGRFFMR